MTSGSRIAILGGLACLALAAPLDAALAVMPVQATHPCAKQAVDRALGILESRIGSDERTKFRHGEVKVLNPIKAPDGKGWLDVLEVLGAHPKGKVRVHLHYAQGDQACTLKGEDVADID